MDMPYRDIKSVLEQFDELVRYLKKQSREKVAVHVHITGGEPFLHPDIHKILWLLRRFRYKYRYGIMSNGTVLNSRNLWLIKGLHLKAFQVSLDGNQETHDSIRGIGNFEKVIHALDQLAEWRIPARVSFTANKENFHQFPQVAEVCRKHYVRTLWSDRYIPFDSQSKIHPLDKADMPEYVAILRRERENVENQRCGLYVQNYRALQFLGSEDSPYSCQAGDSLVTVDEHGNIFPCRRLPIPCGNIHTTSILEVYRYNDVFKSLRQYEVSGKCKTCEYSKTCKGGERCFTYAISGKFDIPDLCCWLEK
ncbi:MAG: radical SAM protein [Roseburia sp.]|nr:radical SAM protein [Roseburia sp.]MCM1098690.1 radical SAM protein [Ruminococcus flavefaciens]